ncbi:MAG: cysteine hydrolase, partial [Candidatus Methanoplasma sp.]|nr:cysteine hydrolase [Candidatus Methanoplasma sp.]
MKDKKDLNAALVIVDMQRKFIPPECADLSADCKRRLGRINEAIDAFRTADRPVLFVQYEGPSECVRYPFDDGDEWVEGLHYLPGDAVVRKSGMNSFRGPALADAVRGAGCEGVILAGLVAQYCVIATYFGAFDHDLESYLLEGGSASNDPALAECVERVCKTFTMEDV